MILIVDFGMGNLRSIQHKLEKANVEAVISSRAEDIEAADKLILPGVGHFSTGMKNLKGYGLVDILDKKVNIDKIPILGICLGMQLFTKFSEEGDVEGLGWIDATVKNFSNSIKTKGLKVPHVGWNNITLKRQTPLFDNVDSASRFYFTHSYYVECNDQENIVASSDYGLEFASMIQKENIYGTQFHPEKSHFNGFEIIKNFIRI